MKTTRKFAPGSGWLYLKIYTGIKTADIILEEVIKPLTEHFEQEKKISKWFFIRYNDPKSHLRLRCELTNSENKDRILAQIHESFKNYIDSGEISNCIIDTYNRELERYGAHTMVFAEELFYQNSRFTLECLQFDDEEKIMTAIFQIDQLLDKINLSINEKLEWIKDFNQGFKKEFNADKKLNSQLDKKYREFRPKYLDFLQSDEFLEDRNAVVFNIEGGNSALQNIIFYEQNQSLEISFQDFFQSIFHMNINRLFVSNQRLFEMVIYDYLLRYYKTKAFIDSEN